MTWIRTIPYEQAEGRLKKIYDRVKGPENNVDNVLLIHSLRPHTLQGHMTLYKAVLHHSGNTLPKWYLELLGVYVSQLNKCEYCSRHHLAGLARLIDSEKVELLAKAIRADKLDELLDPKELAGCSYARRLTVENHNMKHDDLELLRQHDFSDGEILEVNQVVSYFNYVNRTVNGLGVHTEGDILGLSPSDGEGNESWKHG